MWISSPQAAELAQLEKEETSEEQELLKMGFWGGEMATWNLSVWRLEALLSSEVTPCSWPSTLWSRASSSTAQSFQHEKSFTSNATADWTFQLLMLKKLPSRKSVTIKKNLPTVTILRMRDVTSSLQVKDVVTRHICSLYTASAVKRIPCY